MHQVVDEVFWRKDGSAFLVEYTSTPIRKDGRPVGAVKSLFRDVSERKATEQKLRLALEELERLKQRLEMENAYLQEEIRENTTTADPSAAARPCKTIHKDRAGRADRCRGADHRRVGYRQGIARHPPEQHA